jgi:transposase
MSRYDLTDFEWRVIEPLLPNKARGYRASMTAAC